MDNRAASLHGIAAARGNTRCVQARGPVLACVLALVLAGCASGPQVCTTRTEIQRVPTPVFIDIPAEFVVPLDVPALPDDLTNRDLEADIRALEDVIDEASADRADLLRIQQQRRQRQQ